MAIEAAMPFNFSCPEYLSHHKRRKNGVSPVSRASPTNRAGSIRAEPLNRMKTKRLVICVIFVGSRACAANHYVIAGKCPYAIYLCMSTSSTDCRLSEQVSITQSLHLSGNVVKHTELLKKNISCLQGASICIYDDLETF